MPLCIIYFPPPPIRFQMKCSPVAAAAAPKTVASAVPPSTKPANPEERGKLAVQQEELKQIRAKLAAEERELNDWHQRLEATRLSLREEQQRMNEEWVILAEEQEDLEEDRAKLVAEQEALKEERAMLAAEQQEMNDLHQRLEAVAVAADDLVELDVRGQNFSTRKSNLMENKKTFFYGMLSSGRYKPNARGKYFIDRYFRI